MQKTAFQLEHEWLLHREKVGVFTERPTSINWLYHGSLNENKLMNWVLKRSASIFICYMTYLIWTEIILGKAMLGQARYINLQSFSLVGLVWFVLFNDTLAQ